MNALLAVPFAPKVLTRWNAEDFSSGADDLLKTAADALKALAAHDEDRVHPIIDALSNDTAKNFQELRAQIEACKVALCEIEARTYSQLAVEAAYHRENLRSIESLGVPLEA